MLWLQWIGGTIFFVLAAHLMILNGMVFWKGYVKREKTGSWIPLLGGVLGAIALLLIPAAAVNRWWWILLLLDWGCLPGFLYTAFWYLSAKPDPD